MMTGKQKLYFLLDAIDDARQISPSGSILLIHPTHDLNNKYRDIELVNLFTKLQKDEKALIVKKVPQGINSVYSHFSGYQESDNGSWHVTLLPAFHEYFQNVQYEPEYIDFTGKKPVLPRAIQLSRKSLEKTWNLLQEIENKRGITKTGDEISIQLVHVSKVKNMREAQEYADERRNILRKLEFDYKAIKDLRLPDSISGYVYLKLGTLYFEVFEYIEAEYKKRASEYQNQRSSDKYEKLLAEISEKNHASSEELKARYAKTLSEIKSSENNKIQKKPEEAEVKTKKKATYDYGRRKFSLNGKQFEYREGKRPEILGMLFKKKGKIFTDEVLEEVYGANISDYDVEKAEKLKKMVHAQYQGIADRVAVKTGITDFLIFDFNSAQINPIYL